MSFDDRHLHAPLDPATAERLAAQGLRYALVGDDDAAIDAWSRADLRGFHADAPDPADSLTARRRDWYRRERLTGVWRPGDRLEPVATTSSWLARLTVPGPAELDLWSISSVTVDTTHLGRGYARALLEGELRTAAALGIPAAGLTVSESTLYGRYGFGIAAQAASVEIDTTRVRWAGPEPDLELEFVDVETAAADFERLHAERVAATAGDVSTRPTSWRRITGADDANGAATRKRRFVRALRGDEAVGIVAYTLTESDHDFTHHTLDVEALAAPGRDAAAALWRFVVGQPLVRKVIAGLLALDDPLRWWLGDWRGAIVRVVDHHWLRILDVPAALAARAYAGEGPLGLRVRDSLGFCEGDYLLESDAAGRAAVEAVRALPAGTPTIELDAATLASMWLGAFSPSALAAAGRTDGDGVDAADRLFAVGRAPLLSTWY
ncbi:MAG: GNAT family N-acetyltransferase [Microbacteriaceae bacterium]|nr:GNAT family N-acetyltransferase [Microbacteriaceae bacterium]